MSFKDIYLDASYSSEIDDVLFDFYIPVLKEAVKYDRLAGFFSSSSLAIASKGIINFISNGGKMRLIVSPILSKKDVEAIVNSERNPEYYITQIMLDEIEEAEEQFRQEPIRALSWMIASDMLDLKIAIVQDIEGNILNAKEIEQRGIFHQKVGILYDKNKNIISFSGSINETAYAWLENVEEFKVFRNWEDNEYEFLKSDIEKFNRLWNGLSKRIRIFKTPEAVLERFIENSPTDINKINWDLYYNKQKRNKITLFEHQKKAIDYWIRNNFCGLFEMATGTGKTYTALGCYTELEKRMKSFATIITTPKNHLVQQWIKEVGNFGIRHKYMVADSTNRKWESELYNALSELYMGYYKHYIIFTTHNTFSNDKFTSIIRQFEDKINLFLIADEVHGVGADRTSLGLKSNYNYRLGLSATPERWFDIEGTVKVYDFFKVTKDNTYKFGLRDAIYEVNSLTDLTYLTPYLYNIYFTELTDKEVLDYMDLTQKIIRTNRKKKKNDEKNITDKYIGVLLYERADIIKDAENKYNVLEEILDKIGDEIKWTLIYCSPKQIDNVMDILNRRQIICHKFTMNEGTKPLFKYGGVSEREYLLNLFGEGKYQVLVSMHCLDEGVDIPPARNAIFMSSSGNPREYIQRIGRVIRRYKYKSFANIYDIIIRPKLNYDNPMINKIEKIIFVKQLSRCKEIAEIASNNVIAINIINTEIRRIGGI